MLQLELLLLLALDYLVCMMRFNLFRSHSRSQGLIQQHSGLAFLLQHNNPILFFSRISWVCCACILWICFRIKALLGCLKASSSGIMHKSMTSFDWRDYWTLSLAFIVKAKQPLMREDCESGLLETIIEYASISRLHTRCRRTQRRSSLCRSDAIFKRPQLQHEENLRFLEQLLIIHGL